MRSKFTTARCCLKVIGAPRLWTLKLALMLMQLVVVAVGEAVGDVETLMQLVVVAVGDVEALMQLAVGDSGVAHHVDRVSHRPRTRS